MPFGEDMLAIMVGITDCYRSLLPLAAVFPMRSLSDRGA